MKHILKLILLTAFVASILCGCESPKWAAYKSLSSIAYAVDGAMKAEASLYVQGKIPQATHDKIAYIKDKEYNPAFAIAIQAAKLDYTKPAPAELGEIAGKLISLIDQFIHPKPATP